jgi:23S rRNA pseudouridine1911/1915/1917 synthase
MAAVLAGRPVMSAPEGPASPPDATRIVLQARPEHDGWRLDRFLAAVVPGRSRSELQRLVKDGRVASGSRHLRPSTRVRAGDVVVVELPAPRPATLEPEPLPLAILYEDADLVVIDKPPGLVVHPAAGHASGTLVHALLYHVRDLSGVGGERRPGIVHRLDRGTSGVMVVAKHDRAHEALARQFRDRAVEKEYVALVWGLVRAGRCIDLPIGRDPHHRHKMSARVRRGRAAVTRILEAEWLRGVSLVRLAPATGRTHQIRVHLSAIGHPVVGDATYGGVRRRVPAHLRCVGALTRPFLHAARLVFTHPRDGRRVSFEAPLAADLAAVLEALRAGVGRTPDSRGARS